MNRKEITILALITFTTVLAWIAFDIYHARNATTITEIQQQEVVPLTPAFDDEVIRQLQTRED